ncbi:hypothetical protein EMCRGX_G006220 [Ephydatia muelleri]
MVGPTGQISDSSIFDQLQRCLGSCLNSNGQMNIPRLQPTLQIADLALGLASFLGRYRLPGHRIICGREEGLRLRWSEPSELEVEELLESDEEPEEELVD